MSDISRRTASDANALTTAVIICAYTLDRWNDLVCAVESVQAQTRVPTQIVIVIDHNPALLERARTRFPALRVVENTLANGLSGARNSGIAASASDAVAFLDDDAVADADWLETLVRVLDDPNVLGAGGRILPRWSVEPPGWFPDEFLWVVGCSHRGLPAETAEVRNLVGASMLIRRAVFASVGGFRSDMGRVGAIPLGCEETEFCIRAHQRFPGASFVYVPSAIVHHTVPATRARGSYFWARCYAEGISKAFVSRLVGSGDGLSAERAHAFVTLPKGVLRALRDALFHRDRSGWGRAGAITAGLFITGVGYLRGRAARPAAPAPDGVGVVETERPLRILMVSARYFPLMGGTETHIYEAARRLAALGHSVTVLTTDAQGDLPCEEAKDGVTVRRVRAFPRGRDYYFAPQLYPIIAHGDWDVVHVQGYHTLVAPLAMLASWRAGISFVVTFHSGGNSSQFRNSGRNLQRRLLRRLLNHAAQLIGVSEFEADFFAETLGFNRARFVVVPNGAHLPTLSHPVAPAPFPLIVSSGRLERYKGHQRVIAALPRVLEQRADVRLRIAGAGPYEETLRTLARDLGVAEHVEIASIPPDNREGMAELFSRAALVTLFSEYEAHPVAVMEALSLKRPVLVADTSGLSELARKGLVCAVAPDASSDDLATAILQQLDSPLIPAEIALPTWDDCAARLLAVYQHVARRAQPA